MKTATMAVAVAALMAMVAPRLAAQGLQLLGQQSGGVWVMALPPDAGSAVAGPQSAQTPFGFGEQVPTVIVLNGSAGSILILVLPPAYAGAPATVPTTAPATAPRPGDDAGFVDVPTSLNVRTGPGLQYQRVGGLPPGLRVKIVGQRDGWCQIAYGGGTAWICGDYVWRPGTALHDASLAAGIRRWYASVGRQDLAARVPTAPKPAAAPAPAATPASGSLEGRRLRDGGLAVPVLDQNHIGAKYPGGFCGPTALKMSLAYFGIKKDINFLGLADVGGATPLYRMNIGSSHRSLLDMARHCGAKSSAMAYGKSLAWLKAQTDAGHPIIVNVRGNYGAPFTTGGHYVVVVGFTSDGRVIINDSADGKRRAVSATKFYQAWSDRGRWGLVVKK